MGDKVGTTVRNVPSPRPVLPREARKAVRPSLAKRKMPPDIVCRPACHLVGDAQTRRRQGQHTKLRPAAAPRARRKSAPAKYLSQLHVTQKKEIQRYDENVPTHDDVRTDVGCVQ